jgi:hypothetical protein
MASIENRSRFIVTVKQRDDLRRSFPYNREAELQAYVAKLRLDGFKPKLERTQDSYSIRIREAGTTTQCLYASSEQEAIDITQQLELERRNGL